MTESSSPGGKVLQIYGPPGTGKTHNLTARVSSTVRQYGVDSIAVCSFSVTAAAEIASRTPQLPRRSVGTLHSFAKRSLGGEHVVALDPEVLRDWNSMVGPEWRITPDSRRGVHAAHDGGAGPGTRSGDELISALDKARATFTDREEYPSELAKFDDAWSEWKRANDALDFTDMVAMAYERAKDGERFPGNPSVLVVDEGQDNTPLETALQLEWGKHARTLVVALDDDQAINEWRGGSPQRMLTLGKDDGFEVERTVLGKSYRIPRAVHAVAERWVRRISMRHEKRYDPRTVFADGHDTGEIVEGAAYLVKETLHDVELVRQIESEVARGRRVMVVASCSYMLETLIKNLKMVGLPFHNPFRPTESRWNPLGGGSGVSTAERVYRYLVSGKELGDAGRLWTGEDIRAWIDLVKADAAGLRRGAKAEAERFDNDTISWETVAGLWSDPEQRDIAVQPSLDWLASMILPSKMQRAAYPLQVARKRGALALAEKPLVTIGTIHSFKGADADVVYVAPDLSTAGAAQTEGGLMGRDQTVRLFYVAMTRAKEELRILTPAHSKWVKPRDLIPPDLEVPA